jgi:lipopolysaccharide export system permease protein
MRILNRYVTVDFLVTFSMTVLVFTFVMCGAAFIKAIDLMSRGVSAGIILKVFGYNIPFIMSFSIPMSVMTTVLLLFGRLSFDGELTAMKAGGLSIWQVTSPILLVSLVLSGVCVYLNFTAAPNGHFARRQALVELGAEDPVNLLDEGRFTKEFPGLQIYIGKKVRSKVRDVVVFELDEKGQEKQYIRAQSGEIRMDADGKQLLIDLADVRIERPDERDPMDPTKSRTIIASRYPVKLDVRDVLKTEVVRKRAKDMTFRELLHAIENVRTVYPERDAEQQVQSRMKMMVEVNTRLALSVCCFTFALLGIPLGMRSRRKESSRGIAVSLAVVFGFYFFEIMAESLVSAPSLRPDLLVWVPVLVGQVVGFFLLQRSN